MEDFVSIKDFLQKFFQQNIVTPTPYTAEYLINTTAAMPTTIDIKKFPGLKAFYFVRTSPEKAVVISFWETKEVYHRDASRFCLSMGATSGAYHGYLENFTAPAQTLWERAPKYTVIISIVAFLGALRALGDYFDLLLAAPSLSSTTEKQHIDVFQDTEFSISESLSNGLPVAHKNITIKSSMADKFGTIPLKTDPDNIRYIPELSSKSFLITGKSPRLGTFTSRTTVNSYAGILRGSKEFEFSRNITVWPKSPKGEIGSITKNGRSASLRGTVSVGEAAMHGVNCELELKGIFGLKHDTPLDFPRIDQTPTWLESQSNGGNNRKVYTVRWKTTASPAFEKISYTIWLTKDNDAPWDPVSKNSILTCQYRKEKS